MSLPSDQDASGRSFGPEELAYLKQALDTGTLTSTKGAMVPAFEKAFAQWAGVKHAIACSAGSAAVHIAVAAADPEPGDEIITTPITDMGALTSILYQGAIPVFADVDPVTLNVTADTIAQRLSPRTKAIIVTHLFGNPADMGPILALAEQHKLPVIEDAAQAFGGKWQDRPCGTIGTLGCFSLQQGKHITCGEGGVVTTSDDALARRVRLLVNKAWGYGDPKPDHYFLAPPNDRMTELQAAVARAQLEKLPALLEKRLHAACLLVGSLMKLPGLTLPPVRRGDTHGYWRIPVHVDPAIIPGGVDALAKELRALGIPAAPRYIVKPAFDCEVIRDQRTFGKSRFPFTLAHPDAVNYSKDRFPGAYTGLSTVLIVPLNEAFNDTIVQHIVKQFEQAVMNLTGAAAR